MQKKHLLEEATRDTSCMDHHAVSISASLTASPRQDTSLGDMMDEATAQLQRMAISGRDAAETTIDSRMEISATPTVPDDDGGQIELLQIQVQELKRRLVVVVHQREDSDAIFQRAMQYAAAKGTANAVLHTLFDQASAGKYQVLEQWVDTGVIPTRDGLKHWRLDLRELRNETGATLLHVAVDSSIARQNLKLKCVELLVDRVGFDVNVRDAFGRTPLHVAAMAGYADVTQALLARGADATRRDRAGLSPLSVVRTLSRPPEEVVQLLAAAESGSAKEFKAASDRIPPQTAIASALFLRVTSRFVRPPLTAAFSAQTNVLLDVSLTHKQEPLVAFDQLLREHVPLLFECTHAHEADDAMGGVASEPLSLVRLESLFQNDLYGDTHFVNELKVEAAAYGHSLVNATSTSVLARAGATWEGVLLKLIQAFKVSEAMRASSSVSKDLDQISAVSDTQASTVSERDNSSFLSASSASTALLPLAPPPRSPIYADQASTTQTRQAWHYAVLFKSSTQPFPGSLSVQKGLATATCSHDVGRFFPLHDRLLLGSTEYHCVSYDSRTRVIQLDREYAGVTAAETTAYLAGSCSPLLPPYIASKRIWEREPGNKYEDHLSSEQDLFQDYQFLDPDSAYEVAVKLGPVPTAREARAVVDEWKAKVRRLFEEKKCLSGLACCAHYCPQRSGHSLCVETMAAIGREIAKERLGRATYSKQLKPRASLQKYQDLFLGKAPWPGSPSSSSAAASPHISNGETKSSPSPDFT